MEQIVVGMADCRIAAIPEQILVTFALGSCIGLAVYDVRARLGGLLHYMLPDSAIDPARRQDNPYMFADTGIPLLRVCSRRSFDRGSQEPVRYRANAITLPCASCCGRPACCSPAKRWGEAHPAQCD
jgi:chemotaxis receptor (MCP) glutamine deamidase CheD